MFTPIEDLPNDVIGFLASGRVTREDRKTVLEPVIGKALKQRDRLRLLYVIGSDFSGYEPSTPLDDSVFGTRHFDDFERIAFLAEDGPYRRAADAMDGLMPTKLRVMRLNSIDRAKVWLAS